ncbi:MULTISPECIES: HAMP domain-containing protein [unclassified Sphingomonas]|uniref:HAMP domain-containing protein n=1 Tax=unclassified Sphingomonas TaxID=196159 RepID=UPI0021510143|nr:MULTISPECIES: methyl-accepting chemotaxis protein [unclassified Sphingomonas]MCR5872228.1 methyl-accepting chemotaxis protein [Sphingomonas sp. J344]UUY01517.1 methyl-accepting chemotaxis protein [Sphingomonas sp. J315]
MTITKLVKRGAAGLLVLLFVGGAIIGWQINAVRMGGAMHLESRQMSDLIADILPPPEYIIEPYLEASLIVIDPTSVAAASARLQKLRTVYEQRRAYWQSSTLPDRIKADILEKSDPPAQQFWTILETRFLPAARSGNRPAMEVAYRDLRGVYAQHRAAIDALVVDATDHQAKVESSAATMEVTMVVMLSLLALTLLGAVAGSIWFLIRRIITPMAELSTTTSEMAEGATVTIPHTDRSDELGDIAHALERFASAAQERRAEDAGRLREQQIVNRHLGERLEALRSGDLTQTIDADFPAAYAGLRDNFNAAICALRGMVHAVHASADSIGNGATEIARATEDLARRTEASAANLEQTNAALQQVSARLQVARDSTSQTRAR